jgi:hypothetical protein
MPLTTHIRLPVTDEEHAEVLRKAGDMNITAFLRKMLGLPQRKAGRPPKAATPKPHRQGQG